jgi:hypothetical protein
MQLAGVCSVCLSRVHFASVERIVRGEREDNGRGDLARGTNGADVLGAEGALQDRPASLAFPVLEIVHQVTNVAVRAYDVGDGDIALDERV